MNSKTSIDSVFEFCNINRIQQIYWRYVYYQNTKLYLPTLNFSLIFKINPKAKMRLAYMFILKKHTAAVQQKICLERRVCWGPTLSIATSGHPLYPPSQLGCYYTRTNLKRTRCGGSCEMVSYQVCCIVICLCWKYYGAQKHERKCRSETASLQLLK
jgi:hypothetical protein